MSEGAMMGDVKVMADQTWVDLHGNVEIVERISIPRIHLKGGKYVNSSLFMEDFTFVPANDLEWLAVNCDDFPDRFSSIIKNGDKVNFGKFNGIYDEYTRQQYHEMRVHLGLSAPIINNNIEYSEKSTALRNSIERCCKKISNDIMKAKPVFTQAMADAGIDPVIGQRIAVSTGNGIIKGVGTIHGKACVFVQVGDCCETTTVFKPIDTRTDQEKLLLSILNCEESPEGKLDILTRRFNITSKADQNE